MGKTGRRYGLRLVALVGVLSLAFFAPAFGSADSGYVYRGSIGPFYPGFYVDSCIQASITDTAYNQASTFAWISPSSCFSQVAELDAGWMGINAKGYRDGAYCGQTGTQYTAAKSWTWSASATLCSNPAGSQAFHTAGFGKIWIYQDGAYYDQAGVSSPNQNY